MEKRHGPSEEVSFQLVLEILKSVRWPDCCWSGSLFQDAGPATANARSPKLVFERGTWRLPCAAEQSRERAVCSASDWQSSLRYCGAVPWTALKTRRQSLYLTCSSMRSENTHTQKPKPTGPMVPQKRAYYCAQLCYTIQHRIVLKIFTCTSRQPR